MCNPIGQAWFLNKKKTDLKIIIGLRGGHDLLFAERSLHHLLLWWLMTELAHYPLGAVYSKYYGDKLSI